MTSRRLRPRHAWLAPLTLLALGASLSGPAAASAAVACPNPTATVFSPWGDTSSYAFSPNGGLENAAAGWTLAGAARVVGGNERFAVHGAGDTHSLSLPSGSSATTPPMCIGLFSTKMRFFAVNRGAASSRLRVQAVYHGGLGQVLGVLDQGTVSSGGAWYPSPRFTLLGGAAPLLTTSVS